MARSLAIIEQPSYPAVPRPIAELPNVDRVDELTWDVTIRVSDPIMRQLIHSESDLVRIHFIRSGDRLDLMARRP